MRILLDRMISSRSLECLLISSSLVYSQVFSSEIYIGIEQLYLKHFIIKLHIFKNNQTKFF